MSLHALTRHLAIHSLWMGSVQALVIPDYSSTRHSRFLNFSTSPAHNTQFMHSAYNLSGVGWHTANTARQLTMVSPIHFVGANHYKPGVNATIRFLSADTIGIIRDYTVSNQTAVTNDAGEASDLFIGTLSTTITEADNIKFYPYLNFNVEASYVNKTLIVLGKTGRGAAGTVSQIRDAPSSSLNTTRVLRFNYSPTISTADGCYFQSGDSGSPVFIVENNRAAIVGTNSLVGTISAGGTTTYSNFSNFVPYYADKLNTIMEATGYRMTKAIPGSTSLSLTHELPSGVIRAGHHFTINLNLDNTGGTMAENVKLGSTFSAGATVSSASGSLWFDESTATEAHARRAKLDSGNDTDYSLTLTLPTPGDQVHSVTYSSDQSSPVTGNFNLTVIESFLSWSDELTDKAFTGDDDLDGINNLLEYAFGGDPSTSSHKVSGENVSLLPAYAKTGNTHTLSYVRRKDYEDRALLYVVKSSTTLLNGSFTDASSLISHTGFSSINDDLELVTLTLPTSGTERFFRIEVTLSE